MSASKRLRALVTCSAGVERVVQKELSSTFKIARSSIVQGERSRSGKLLVPSISTRQLYLCNMMMRTADRIYVEGPSFRAREFWELELAFKRAHEQLKPWLRPSVHTHVQCTSIGSKLFHERGVEERIRRLLLEPTYSLPLQSEEEDDAQEQQLMVRIVKDKVTLFIDSSGAPLHQRGWRTEVGKMPLRPTIAAAMLMEAGFHAPDVWSPETAANKNASTAS